MYSITVQGIVSFIHLSYVFLFFQGVLGTGDLQLSSLYAGSNGRQWLGLCLSLPADHLLLVPAAGLRRATCAHS